MSQIFDIVEELEKERKKNKELKSRLKATNKILNDMDDIAGEYEERIDKTIKILEKRINKIENQEWKSYTGQTDEEYLQEQKELLNILRGNNE